MITGLKASNAPLLPFLVAPFLDETFGSWLRRCAQSYATTTAGFISSFLPHATWPRSLPDWDWDTQLCEELVSALVAQSKMSRSELQCLLVPSGPATLKPANRDAYCPECFDEDIENGALYCRRAWLDAWTIRCPAHRCLLGRFSAVKRADAVGTLNAVPRGCWEMDLDSARPLREKAVVRRVVLLPIRGDLCVGDGQPLKDSDWFDSRMLHSIVGRDLLLISGSCFTDTLHYTLFGKSRRGPLAGPCNEDTAFAWPLLEHPQAGVEVRVSAAYFAGILWQCLNGGDRAMREWQGVMACVRADPLLQMVTLNGRGMTGRWPRETQERWFELFGPTA